MAHDSVPIAVLKLCGRQLHQLDRSSIRVANVNNALSGVRSGLKPLRFARCFPTGCRDFLENCVQIIDCKRHVDRSDIARSKIDMLFSIERGEILEQFDFVAAGYFHNRQFDLSAGNAGNLTRHFPGLMRAMRKFETENVLPEVERALEIRNRDAGVIGRNDSKRHVSGNCSGRHVACGVFNCSRHGCHHRRN